MMIQQLKQIKIKGMMPLIVGIILLLSNTIYGQTNLEKGTYSINNQVTHANPVGQGMARSYTEVASELKVTNDGNFMSIALNNTHFMGDFTIKVNGTTTSYETVYHDTQNNIKKLQFKVPNLNATVAVGLYVIPVDTNVEYDVTFDQSTLKLIEKAPQEVVEMPKEEPSTTVTPVEMPQVAPEATTVTKEETVEEKPQAKPSTQETVTSKPQQSVVSEVKVDTEVKVDQKPQETQIQKEEVQEILVEEVSQEEVQEVEEEKAVASQEEVAQEEVEVQEEITQEEVEVQEETEVIEEDAITSASKKEGKTSLVKIGLIVVTVGVIAAGVIFFWMKKRK